MYKSSRNNNCNIKASEAIVKGISSDGGLFVPEKIPELSSDDFKQLKKSDYKGRAKIILSKFLEDFTQEEIDYCVNGAYSKTFDNDEPAPLYKLEDNKFILELWHGPTCAFKDLALQILPYLLTVSTKKADNGQKTVILVATSGDTGKAALEGFKDVHNTEIIVFYPNNGVSKMQKIQMDTQAGNNVYVCAIQGNFDDAQSGVKKIFTDVEISKKLEAAGMKFSSANSINLGRLVPQVVYYVSACCDLANKGVDLNDGFNVVVPTGNFGNILAAYYAKEMGVPINKLICASNKNNVLTEFINTGVYDKNRKFYTTLSPSMDILISSNLERMLYELYNCDSNSVKQLQLSLTDTGRFQVPFEVLQKIKNIFYAAYCDDKATLETIKKYYNTKNYLVDTHTAVALYVYDEYKQKTQDKLPVVIASTASPYKFADSVLKAIDCEFNSNNEFEKVRKLNQITGCNIPNSIKALETADVRFNNLCKKEELEQVILQYLNI